MLLTLITFFLILSVLVLVHELGHFLVAKKTGIGVEEFGFGLPPRIWGKKIGETIYSVNALPFGGFVKLQGEDLDKVNGDKKNQFWAKPKKVRIAVIIAGVIMNFLLACLAFSIIYNSLGIPTKTANVKIVGIAKDSPAEKAGLRENDIILFAAGKEIKNTQDFVEITGKAAGKLLNLEIKREKENPCQDKVLGAYPGIQISCQGENMVFYLVPRTSPPQGEGPLGVAVSQVEMKFYPFWKMIPLGIWEGIKEALAWTGLVVSSIMTMIYQLVLQGEAPKDLAGPVGIFQITGVVARTGILSILQFLGILSVNLAVLNILPLPALDGGRLAFVLIEAVTGKRVKPSAERWVHTVGMALLLFLILLITLNDIRRILETSDIISRLRTLFPF